MDDPFCAALIRDPQRIPGGCCPGRQAVSHSPDVGGKEVRPPMSDNAARSGRRVSPRVLAPDGRIRPAIERSTVGKPEQVHSRDRDQARDFVATYFTAHGLDVVGRPADLDVLLRARSTSSITIADLRYGTEVVLRPARILLLQDQYSAPRQFLSAVSARSSSSRSPAGARSCRRPRPSPCGGAATSTCSPSRSARRSSSGPSRRCSAIRRTRLSASRWRSMSRAARGGAGSVPSRCCGTRSTRERPTWLSARWRN